MTNTELTTEDVEREMEKCSKCSLATAKITVCDEHEKRLKDAMPAFQPTADVERLDEFRQKTYGADSDQDVQALAFLGLAVAGAGLLGVYASRFFAGWGAQVAGGAFVAVLALSVLFGGMATVSRYKGGRSA